VEEWACIVKGDAAVDKARDSWAVAFQEEKFSGPDFNGTWKAAYDGRRMVYYVRVQQKQPIVLPTTLEGFPTVQSRPVRAWSSPIWIVPSTRSTQADK
jgi:hypothetical protein